MVWWQIALALAAPPDEAPCGWLTGRWYVASETIEHDAPLRLDVGSRAFVSPAWQVEGVLDCAPPSRPDRVECRVEDAALRTATFDHWQRPADREIVERLLGTVRAQLRARPVRLDCGALGEVSPVRSQLNPEALSATLLGEALAGLHLPAPPGGWQAGVRWRTDAEPLLAVPHAEAMTQSGAASHGIGPEDGRWVVQTVGTVDRRVVTRPRSRFGYRSTTWLPPELHDGVASARYDARPTPNVKPGAIRRTYPGRLTLRAEAHVDPTQRRLDARRWTVRGVGATQLWRSGQLRRLADEEVVELGPTHQVSLPEGGRPPVAEWRHLLENRP